MSVSANSGACCVGMRECHREFASCLGTCSSCGLESPPSADRSYRYTLELQFPRLSLPFVHTVRSVLPSGETSMDSKLGMYGLASRPITRFSRRSMAPGTSWRLLRPWAMPLSPYVCAVRSGITRAPDNTTCGRVDRTQHLVAVLPCKCVDARSNDDRRTGRSS